MLMYTLGIISLIDPFVDDVQQIWYADVCGKLADMHDLWKLLVSSGLDFGYYLKSSKTCLIVKDACFAEAVSLFEGTGVSITIKKESDSDVLVLLWVDHH